MQTLLPRIVQLWEELQVPLVHRSRFYLAFKGRETFYYEAEHRRLIHQHSQVCALCLNPKPYGSADRFAHRWAPPDLPYELHHRPIESSH